MLEKEESKTRGRMIVEEVELPKASKAEEKVEKVEKTDVKPEILDDGAKVSSQDIMSGEAIKPIEDEPIMETPVEIKKKKSPLFWILIPSIFLLGAILGGVVFYQKGVSTGQTETPTSTPAVSVGTPVPSASPSATTDLTKYTVDIFNGSGIAGEAGKVKTLLTTAGFKVGTAGNAATYDYTKTIIKAKTTVDASYLTQLSTALGKSYVMDTNQTLATSSASDVQVVVGSSKTQ